MRKYKATVAVTSPLRKQTDLIFYISADTLYNVRDKAMIRTLDEFSFPDASYELIKIEELSE